MIAITTNNSTKVKPRAIEFFGSPLLANFELTNITVSVNKDIENEEIWCQSWQLAKRIVEVVKTFGKLRKTESLDGCGYGLSTKVNYRLQR